MGLVYMAKWSLVTLPTFWSLVTLRYIFTYIYHTKQPFMHRQIYHSHGMVVGGPETKNQAGPYPCRTTPIRQAILLPADEVRERPAGAGREEPNQDPFLGGDWTTGIPSHPWYIWYISLHEELFFLMINVGEYTIHGCDELSVYFLSLDIQSYLLRFGVLGMFLGSKYLLRRCLDV